MLPPDDGVGQAELQEEGLEDREVFTRRQAETLRGQTERLRLPGGDGVRDSEGHILRSKPSGSADTQTCYGKLENTRMIILVKRKKTRCVLTEIAVTPPCCSYC